MVNISTETPEEIRFRLERMIRECRLKVYEGAYYFEEFALEQFPDFANPEALAMVRDDLLWSQLVEYVRPIPADRSVELFCLWRFHFPDGADNSGFVGWLAMHLKEKFGTGVFVVCGQNSSDGGIFDYWGGPLELRNDLIQEVKRLVNPR